MSNATANQQGEAFGFGDGFTEQAAEGGDSSGGLSRALSDDVPAAPTTVAQFGAALGVVPWPTPFPDLVGMQCLDVAGMDEWMNTDQEIIDAGYAHGTKGKRVTLVDQYDFEFNPDSVKYPNIARCWYKETVLQLPEDADPRCVERRLNKSHRIRLYFKVDRERKMFDVLCYAYEDPESCTDEFVMKETYTDLAKEQEKHNKFFGEWSFFSDDLTEGSDQYKWNETNSVLTSVNFEDRDVLKSGDITKNMTFYLPKPTAPKVDVGAGWTKAPPDNTQELLDEVKKFFTMEDTAFRTPVEKGAHRVIYAASVKEIKEVETLQERFGADASFQLWWQVTKLDVIDYISADDRQQWEPEWSPMDFEVQNEASGTDGGASIRRTRSRLVILDDQVMVSNNMRTWPNTCMCSRAYCDL